MTKSKESHRAIIIKKEASKKNQNQNQSRNQSQSQSRVLNQKIRKQKKVWNRL